MADTKPHAEDQLRAIHEVLNQNEPDDVLIASIREILYGDPDDEEDEKDV